MSDTDPRADRRDVSIPATVRTSGGSFRDVVTNVSRTGLYLQAAGRTFRPGDRVEVVFSLEVQDRLVPVEVEGRVARLVKDGARRTKGVGVQLHRLKPEALEAIEAYLLGGPVPETTGERPRQSSRVSPPADLPAEAPPLDDDETDPRG